MFENYASFFTEYHTTKVVRIQDWRPRAFCIVFLFLTAIIGVWLVVFVKHGYCEVHTLSPVEYKESTWWNKLDWEQKYANSNGTASYCDNKSFDYYYDEDFQYMNNTCVWDNLTTAVQKEIMKHETHKLHVKTSLGVSTIHGSQITSAFIPYVEELSFAHHMKIIHKGKMETTRFQLEVQDSEGEFRDHTDKLDSVNGTQITFKIDELLSMIGTGLDETNPNANTPQEKEAMDKYRNLNASYRLTGIKIAITLETSNYKFLDSYFDQFEYITKVKVHNLQSIEVPTENAEGWEFWNCGGYESLPTLAAHIYEKTKEQDMYTCGIDVDIIVLDGTVCTTSFYAIFQSLLQLTVLFGIATFFVDNLYQFFSRPFRIAKTTTDMNEWEDFRQNHSIIERVGREAFKRAFARSGLDLSPDYILEIGGNVLNECESPKMELQDSNDTNASSPSGWKFELHCSKDDKLMPPTVLKFPLN